MGVIVGDGGVSWGEEFVVGDGFVAVGAESAGAEASHERGAGLAVLVAELAGVAVRAFVDGDRPTRLGSGQCWWGEVGLVTATPEGLAAGIGTRDTGSSRRERGGAHPTGCRYVTVTRRHGWCLGWWWNG